jgi:hypothetical protein
MSSSQFSSKSTQDLLNEVLKMSASLPSTNGFVFNIPMTNAATDSATAGTTTDATKAGTTTDATKAGTTTNTQFETALDAVSSITNSLNAISYLLNGAYPCKTPDCVKCDNSRTKENVESDFLSLLDEVGKLTNIDSVVNAYSFYVLNNSYLAQSKAMYNYYKKLYESDLEKMNESRVNLQKHIDELNQMYPNAHLDVGTTPQNADNFLRQYVLLRYPLLAKKFPTLYSTSETTTHTTSDTTSESSTDTTTTSTTTSTTSTVNESSTDATNVSTADDTTNVSTTTDTAVGTTASDIVGESSTSTTTQTTTLAPGSFVSVSSDSTGAPVCQVQ